MPDTATVVASAKSNDWQRSICPYCGVGCGILAKARSGQVAEVKGDPAHPVNAGSLCAKGALVAQAITAPGRMLHPYGRDRTSGCLTQMSWESAIDRVASAIQRCLRDFGPDSLMLYGSGQLLTEDYYLFGKLAKGFLGTNNQDTNSRLCMSSTVAAYSMTLGADSPPAAYADIEKAKTFLIVGANMEACHPILFNRIRARKRSDGDVKVVVVDPRRTRTAEIADMHFALRPGADVALFSAMLYEVMLAGGIDRDFIDAHTSGWESLQATLSGYQAELAADLAGVDAQDIVTASRIIASNGPMLTFWTMGVNQSTSGVDKNLALINLSLATGNIGKPGAGPFSLTGQPNAMGGREAGGLAAALPGHRSVTNAEHRREVEEAWCIPAGSIQPAAGATAMDMIQRLEDGAIRLVWIAGSNPLASLPNARRARAALANADVVILQDAYLATESTEAADILLPAAQWSEREGTMTNSERRISYLAKVGEPPGEALPDWEIFCRVARRLGFTQAFRYSGTEEVFDELRGLTRGRDLDYSGLSYDVLKRQDGGAQWPVRPGMRRGTPRLFTDGRFATPDGRARFHVPSARQPSDATSDEYPLALLTGRVKDQWHTRTRTGRVSKLNKSEPEPFLEMHPHDVTVLGLRGGDRVRVVSRRGSFVAPLRETAAIRRGTVFAPFHWGALWDPGGVANDATSDACDPRSGQPELKFAAVRIERTE